jgi:isopentenyldiphosphate isomerase
MEIIDLYDAERRKTGQTMVRGAKVPEGCYRMVVHICIFNNKGEMLIQLRTETKDSWPGVWDISVGGSSQTGDTSRSAAHRELLEELGLDVDFENIRPALTINFKEGFDDYYVLNMEPELERLTLQAEEVQRVRWADMEDVFALIDNGEFIPYQKPLIELLFAGGGRRTDGALMRRRVDWTY